MAQETIKEIILLLKEILIWMFVMFEIAVFILLSPFIVLFWFFEDKLKFD